jgi:hypothetical protein
VTGDLAILLDLLDTYTEVSGKTFQFILGDIHQDIYDRTGKVDDVDVHEIGNEEYIETLTALLREMHDD